VVGFLKHEEKEYNSKIKLPKPLQIEMLKFFMKTSMPRIIKAKKEGTYKSHVE
jgi:hypothetical protein